MTDATTSTAKTAGANHVGRQLNTAVTLPAAPSPSSPSVESRPANAGTEAASSQTTVNAPNAGWRCRYNVPAPRKAATPIAPVTYQARYRAAVQPCAPPRASAPAANAYHARPRPH